jgi:transcriptional antiterminator NusG
MSETESQVFQWYVVQAYSGFEKAVMRSLKERIALHGLDAYFGDILVPTEEVVEIKNGQKRKSERKFYPGYVLVQMAMNDESWHLVNQTPRVVGFVGGAQSDPRPLNSDEVSKILSRVSDSHDKPRPKTLFEPGEVVRVTEGPFADFTGAVERVDYDRSKVQLSVSIFGRSTPVELDFAQVEKT